MMDIPKLSADRIEPNSGTQNQRCVVCGESAVSIWRVTRKTYNPGYGWRVETKESSPVCSKHSNMEIEEVKAVESSRTFASILVAISGGSFLLGLFMLFRVLFEWTGGSYDDETGFTHPKAEGCSRVFLGCLLALILIPLLFGVYRGARSMIFRGMMRISSDQEVCSNIVLNEKSENAVRLEAITKITNQVTLASLLDKIHSPEMQRSIVFQITNQMLLATVALGKSDTSIRVLASEKTTDQTLLENIAQQAQSRTVRGSAIKRLRSKTVLEKLSHDTDPYVSGLAKARFKAIDAEQ